VVSRLTEKISEDRKIIIAELEVASNVQEQAGEMIF